MAALDLGFLLRGAGRAVTGYRQGTREREETERARAVEDAERMFSEWAKRNQADFQNRQLEEQSALRRATIDQTGEMGRLRAETSKQIQDARDEAAAERAKYNLGNRPIQIDKDGRPWVLDATTNTMRPVEGDARFPSPGQGGAGGYMSDQQRNSLVERLRSGFTQNPKVKEAYGIANAVGGIQSALRGSSPMSDLQLVYSVIKFFDPNSVVKEGEIKLTRSANSLPGKAQLLLSNWTKGRILTPQMRDWIAELVEERARGVEDFVTPVQREYGARARREGLSADSSYIAPSPLEGLDRRSNPVVPDARTRTDSDARTRANAIIDGLFQKKNP